MGESADQPPTDIAELQARLAAAIAERDAAIAARNEALSRNDRLWGLLRQLQRMQFGRHSEKLDTDQLGLAFEVRMSSKPSRRAKPPTTSRTRRQLRRAPPGAAPIAARFRLICRASM